MKPFCPKTLDAMTLDEIIAHRSRLLTDYQNEGLCRAFIASWSIRSATPRAMAAMARRCRAAGRDQLCQAAGVQGRV